MQRTFKRKYHNNVYLGAVFLVIAGIVWIMNGTTLNKVIISACFVLVGILMIFQNLMQKLKFTDDAVIVTGLLSKKVDYVNIGSIGNGKVMMKTSSGSGYMHCINILTKQGKKIRLVPYNFANYEGEKGWASLLLKIIENNAINIEPNVEQSLQRAAKTQVYKPQFLTK